MKNAIIVLSRHYPKAAAPRHVVSPAGVAEWTSRVFEDADTKAAAPRHVVSPAGVAEWTSRVFEDADTKALADAAWNHGLRAPLLDHTVLQRRAALHVFDHVVTPKMEASDQKQSGRCWAFAGLSLLRRHLARTRCLPDDFELSQSYVYFYDQLEKANAFLQNVLRTRTRPDSNDRDLHFLLTHPLTDGGDWHTFVALVRKYGVVPAAVFPDSDPARYTRTLHTMLRVLLLQTAARVRAAPNESAAHTEIDLTLHRVHRLLCACLGAPPSMITWDVAAKAEDSKEMDAGAADGRPRGHKNTKVTRVQLPPCALFAECENALQLSSYVVLANVPSSTKAFGTAYHVRYGNTVLGTPSLPLYYNVGDLRGPARAALDAGCAVYFASEFDRMRAREEGLLHHGLVQHKRAIGEDLFADKSARVDARLVNVDHAMLLTGYHAPGGGEVERWQVENSHGTERASGYLSMTDEWFRAHVFWIAVPRECVAAEAGLDTFPKTELPPWDVFGSVMCGGPFFTP